MSKPEQEPLESAYVDLRGRLASFARSFKVSEDDASDALQDSYLRLQGRPIRSEEEAQGTLVVTLRRILIDRWRSSKRKATEKIDELSIVDDSASILSAPSEGDIINRLRACLSPLQFEIMRLLVIEDLDYPEIAERMNMREGTIRTNVSRARKTLRENLFK